MLGLPKALPRGTLLLLAFGAFATTSCETEAIAPVDPLGQLRLVPIESPARSFVALDRNLSGNVEAVAAVARDLDGDVYFAGLGDGSTIAESIPVGAGPRSIATCARGDRTLLV